MGLIPGPISAGFNKFWSSYNAHLERYPIRTQAATSGALWVAGDVLAQRVEWLDVKDRSLRKLVRSPGGQLDPERRRLGGGAGVGAEGLSWRAARGG